MIDFIQFFSGGIFSEISYCNDGAKLLTTTKQEASLTDELFKSEGGKLENISQTHREESYFIHKIYESAAGIQVPPSQSAEQSRIVREFVDYCKQYTICSIVILSEYLTYVIREKKIECMYHIF